MKILIPPSEGKAKIKPQEIKFQDTDFIFERSVRQVARQLNLIDNYDKSLDYCITSLKASILK